MRPAWMSEGAEAPLFERAFALIQGFRAQIHKEIKEEIGT
jgi:hypothetical protein